MGSKKLKNRIKSAQLIPMSFLAAILVGTFVLMLPVSTADGMGTDLVTALFTATTSICVTGLVVVDTFQYWSLFGKVFILILIQAGGLGIITILSVLMLMIHKRFSLSQSLVLHDAFNLSTISGLRRFLGKVLIGTLAVEGIGALLYMPVFIPQFGVGRGIWYSVFTAISAFCNAGIDILGPDSLISYNDNPLVMINTMMLIVLSGLGYVVWFDVIHGIKVGIRKKYSVGVIVKRFSEHTKLVISVTLFLIISGALVVFMMEYSNPETIGNMSLGGKIMNSLFQSITFRTAGFASVPQQSLTGGSCAIGIFYMFIGGSPVGTAGGVKTITIFVIFANAVSFIRSRNETVVFGRLISSDLIQKATAIVTVSFTITLIMVIALMATNPLELIDAMYEMFSATATVGLSRAVTPTLNIPGRLLVIVSMYLGRIGPISMALFFNYKTMEKNKVHYIKGNYFVG